MHRAVALRVRGRERREEPRRTFEEIGARPRRSARLGSADRMPADESRVLPGRGTDGTLRRAGVRDRACRRRVREHLLHHRRKNRDRDRDERDVGVDERGRERRRRGDCSSLDGDVERRRILVPARDVGDAGAARGECRRSADEPGADDREPHCLRQTVRMSSATRNARSSDWRPLRRGSHSVS